MHELGAGGGRFQEWVGMIFYNRVYLFVSLYGISGSAWHQMHDGSTQICKANDIMSLLK